MELGLGIGLCCFWSFGPLTSGPVGGLRNGSTTAFPFGFGFALDFQRN